MSWVAMHGTLNTQDRVMKWQPRKQMHCALCGQGMDSHEHLFFSFQYSSQVWDIIKNDAKISLGSIAWKDVIELMIKQPNISSNWVVINKLIFNDVIYCIWA